MRWSAINLKPVNQAFRFTPNPHVSLKISIIQKTTHIMIDINIVFHARPKCSFSLRSIMAIAINSNSSDSSANDFGKGVSRFRFIMNQLTTISVQKTAIFHLNAAYTKRIANGDKQIIANELKPALMNSYIASANRRKSNATLPPLS